MVTKHSVLSISFTFHGSVVALCFYDCHLHQGTQFHPNCLHPHNLFLTASFCYGNTLCMSIFPCPELRFIFTAKFVITPPLGHFTFEPTFLFF